RPHRCLHTADALPGTGAGALAAMELAATAATVAGRLAWFAGRACVGAATAPSGGGLSGLPCAHHRAHPFVDAGGRPREQLVEGVTARRAALGDSSSYLPRYCAHAYRCLNARIG